MTEYDYKKVTIKPHTGPWKLSDFEVGCPLGKGKFGNVYLARTKTYHIPVALKILFKSQIVNSNVEQQVFREIQIQKNLQHPNILVMYNYFFDDKKIYLVLEYALNGELYKKLQQCGKFDEKQAAKYIYQVSDALNYCHQKNVIHRDIKPENILLDENGDVKIADFGWSVHTQKQRHTMCGTLDYLPPEMVTSKAHSKEVDYWCVGVLCYEFLCGKPAFETATTHETYSMIAKAKFVLPDHVSKSAQDLIKKLLVVDASKRLRLDQVMRHRWIRSNYTPKIISQIAEE